MCGCVHTLSHLQLFVTPWTVCSPPRSSVHGDSPGKKTAVGCHFHLHGIFPTQGWNPRLLPWQADSLPMCHLGSPISRFTFSLFYRKEERGREEGKKGRWEGRKQTGTSVALCHSGIIYIYVYIHNAY